MKKQMTAIIAAGVIAVLSITALAADVSGLHAFLDTNSYTDDTFTDVAAGSWYESGVKTVYEKGIMAGMSVDGFSPSVTVTWGQAVTIAARLHAVYNGTTIPEKDGAWYVKYVAYAESAGLLPSTTPEGTSVATATISRQELAGLFRSVLSESDLPAVNDADIPDLQEVLPEFRTAVQDMYAAGIFTGKDGGRFDPNGQATRAEIAVVITRLLCPGQRVSYDSAADRNMADQWGNYKSGGFAARYGDVTYYTTRERVDADSWKSCIVARRDNGETYTVYETPDALTRLAAADDGLLYFVENKNRLMSLDPGSGKAVQLHRSPESVEHFVFYDGEIYLLECYSLAGMIEDWKYRIGRVESNGLTILVNNLTYRKVSDLDILHAFNGKLYYSYGEEKYTSGSNTFYRHTIWSLDLETGKTARIYADNLYMGDVCFDGATYWHFRENEDGLYEIVRGNLLMTEHEEVLAVLPEAATKLYNHLYANGSRVFFQSSGAASLWEISAAGKVSEPIKLPTVYYERSSITDQGIVFHALETLSVLLPHQITVLLPDGSSENYLRFLNMPYTEKKTDLFETKEKETIWDDNTVVAGEVSIEAEKAYYSPEGDLVMELSICNGLDNQINLTVITLALSDGDRETAAAFYMIEEIAAGTECVISVVITAERLDGAFDLAAMEKEISLKYSKQG